MCHSVHRGGVCSKFLGGVGGGVCSKFSGGGLGGGGGGICSKFSEGQGLLHIFGGVSVPHFGGGVSAPNFWGGVCSKFSGGVSAPNFRGGVCSKFSGGVSAPNFRGGCLLQIFEGGVSNFRNMVNVRPVHILLECILVTSVSRILSTEEGGCLLPRGGSGPRGRGVPAPGGSSRPPHRYCCGRYASY